MTAFPPTLPGDLDNPAVISEHDWQAFRSLTSMHSHWQRPSWPDGRRSYHWLVDCSQFDSVRRLAEHCQARLDSHLFDLVPFDSLHVTLGRVGFTDEITKADALAVATAAVPHCATLPPFWLTVGPLAGSRGALRFTIAPWTPLLTLHDQLTAATQAVLGERAVMDRQCFRPHLSIAYANTDVHVRLLLPVLERLRALPTIPAEARSVALVELRRVGRAYRYQDLHTLLLGHAQELA